MSIWMRHTLSLETYMRNLGSFLKTCKPPPPTVRVYSAHFSPFVCWNIDEMGVSFDGMSAKVFTTVKNARRERDASIGHTTIALATNAAGAVGPTLFIHEGSVAMSVPTSAHNKDITVFTAHNETAYMNLTLFEQYVVRFIDVLREKQAQSGEKRSMLIIVDGHKSRLNGDLMFHCAVRSVVKLELPSHLTHLLQPND